MKNRNDDEPLDFELLNFVGFFKRHLVPFLLFCTLGALLGGSYVVISPDYFRTSTKLLFVSDERLSDAELKQGLYSFFSDEKYSSIYSSTLIDYLKQLESNGRVEIRSDARTALKSLTLGVLNERSDPNNIDQLKQAFQHYLIASVPKYLDNQNNIPVNGFIYALLVPNHAEWVNLYLQLPFETGSYSIKAASVAAYRAAYAQWTKDNPGAVAEVYRSHMTHFKKTAETVMFTYFNERRFIDKKKIDLIEKLEKIKNKDLAIGNFESSSFESSGRTIKDAIRNDFWRLQNKVSQMKAKGVISAEKATALRQQLLALETEHVYIHKLDDLFLSEFTTQIANNSSEKSPDLGRISALSKLPPISLTPDEISYDGIRGLKVEKSYFIILSAVMMGCLVGVVFGVTIDLVRKQAYQKALLGNGNT